MIASAGYDRDAAQAQVAEYKRGKTLSGQNIAALIHEPKPEAMREREACVLDFGRFCKSFYPLAFRHPFSRDHRRVIQKIEDAAIRGLLAAFAMPRGYGKSTMCKAATLWAVLNGHRRWPVLIGATSKLGIQLLKSGLKPALTTNHLLAAAFPEACEPFKALRGSATKAMGQHYNGALTGIVWDRESLVFPRIPVPFSKCAESRVTCFGIEGAIRGQVATLSTGEELRPDFVLVDDPQTKATAKSEGETQNRYEIIMGDVLGLAGGDTSIAGLIPCTVIEKGDLAERLLDHSESSEMRGERTKMVYSFPTNEKLWEEYFAIRENNLATDPDGNQARQFYLANREAMDAGAEVAWPEMFPKEFASCIERAMFLRNRNPHSFAAEYQNEPVVQDEAEGAFLTAQQIQGKINGYERGEFPTAATTLTGFIDVQQDCLFWAVAAWQPDFTGYVVDYGSWPQQNRSYFSYRGLRHTIAMRYPNMGTEASITAALGDLTDNLFGRVFRRDDGATIPLSRVLVDSGWQSETVYAFTRQSKHRSSLLPSKGWGLSASSQPYSHRKAKPGERRGENWIIKPVSSNKAIRLVDVDTNSWKTFVQLRLATALGDPGCLSLFKATHYDHRMIAEHMTAENPIKTEGPWGQLWEWKLPANKPDNHLLDCVVGSAVAASIEGVVMKERTARGVSRKRVSLAEMQARAKGK